MQIPLWIFMASLKVSTLVKVNNFVADASLQRDGVCFYRVRRGWENLKLVKYCFDGRIGKHITTMPFVEAVLIGLAVAASIISPVFHPRVGRAAQTFHLFFLGCELFFIRQIKSRCGRLVFPMPDEQKIGPLSTETQRLLHHLQLSLHSSGDSSIFHEHFISNSGKSLACLTSSPFWSQRQNLGASRFFPV